MRSLDVVAGVLAREARLSRGSEVMKMRRQQACAGSRVT